MSAVWHALVHPWSQGIMQRALVESLLRRKQVDGLLLTPTTANRELLATLAAGGKALVLIDRYVEGLDADCVLFCTQVTAGADLGAETTADVCRLLESGKNVVTAIGYHYPAFHGPELVDRLESACRAGLIFPARPSPAAADRAAVGRVAAAARATG